PRAADSGSRLPRSLCSTNQGDSFGGKRDPAGRENILFLHAQLYLDCISALWTTVRYLVPGSETNDDALFRPAYRNAAPFWPGNPGWNFRLGGDAVGTTSC